MARYEVISILVLLFLWGFYRSNSWRLGHDFDHHHFRQSSFPVLPTEDSSLSHPTLLSVQSDHGHYIAPLPKSFTSGKYRLTRGLHEGIFYQTLEPENPSETEAVVVCFHGYGDHSDFGMIRHAHHLRDTLPNTAVVIFDQPGCGRSEGLWGFIESWETHVAKCEAFVSRFVKSEFPQVPLFALGFSLGAGLVLSLDVCHSGLFQGAVLFAPMCGYADHIRPPCWTANLLRVVAELFPKLPIFPLPGDSSIGSALYTDIEAGRRVSAFNHLGYKLKPRLKTALSIHEANRWLERNRGKVRLPFLIVHGKEDEITWPETSEKLHEEAASEDKGIVIMKGFRHQILGEGNSEENSGLPLDLAAQWLKRRIDGIKQF